MSEPTVDEQLWQASALLEQGQRADARAMLIAVARRVPGDQRVWVGLSQAAASPEEERRCFEQLLKLDPGNAWAIAGIARLAAEERAAAPPPPPPPPPSVLEPTTIVQKTAPPTTPDPWAGDVPDWRRCPACAKSISTLMQRCPRCQVRLWERPPPEGPRSLLLHLVMLVTVVRLQVVLGFSALELYKTRLWEAVTTDALYFVFLAALLAPLTALAMLRRWEAWWALLGFAIGELIGHLLLILIAGPNTALLVGNFVDVVLIGLLFYVRDEVSPRLKLIELPPPPKQPKGPAGAHTAGVAYSRRGQWYLAARMWQIAARLDFYSGPYRRSLGHAYLRLGKLDAAESELRAALYLEPDDRQAAALLTLLEERRAQQG